MFVFYIFNIKSQSLLPIIFSFDIQDDVWFCPKLQTSEKVTIIKYYTDCFRKQQLLLFIRTYSFLKSPVLLSHPKKSLCNFYWWSSYLSCPKQNE